MAAADYSIKEYITDDDTYTYGSKLELTAISSYHVGEYYCINRDQEEFTTEYENMKINNKASSIYVFVEGKKLNNFLIIIKIN